MTDMKHESECIHRYELPKSFFFGGADNQIEVTGIVVRIYTDGYVSTEDSGYRLTKGGKRRSQFAKHVVSFDESPEQAEYEQAVATATADALSRCKRSEA